MKERRSITLGERWRRESNRNIDDKMLERALTTMPSIRQSMMKVRPGAIRAEIEGAMGSIHETAIHVAPLQQKYMDQLARVLHRSRSILEALQQGRVPRSFDRLVARICGEALFPEPRRVSSACTCNEPERPCHHLLAVHELFARRLDDKPWELILVRGIELPKLLMAAQKVAAREEIPELQYGASEEPVLYPEGEDTDLDDTLTAGQVLQLLGRVPDRLATAVEDLVDTYRDNPEEALVSPTSGTITTGKRVTGISEKEPPEKAAGSPPADVSSDATAKTPTP